MKTLIFCVALVGVAGYVQGQSPETQLKQVVSGTTEITANEITHLKVVSGPATEITANEIAHSEADHMTRARGQVRIVFGSTTITADEADLHHDKDTPAAVDLTVDLRGHVRVVVTPSNDRRGR